MDSLFSALPVTEAVSEPGVAYRYSNVGYAILGAAISRAAKKPFVDYVRANVIRALGMTSNRLRAVGGNAIAADDRVDYDVLVKDSLNYDDAADSHRNGVGLGVAVGALYSTVGDLAKLVSLELGFGPDSVLSAAASARRDAVPLAADPTIVYGYGLGTQTNRWSDTTATGHSGNVSGYTSQIYYDRARGYGVIVLRSAGGGQADASRLAGRAFRKLVSLERGVRP
jgi:D-alanyl-D-alanine carboxypeptidase